MYTIAHDGEPPTELEALVTSGFLDASILAGDGKKRSHIAYLPLTKAELDRLRRKRLDLPVVQWFELECVHKHTRWVADARGAMRRATTPQVIDSLRRSEAELLDAGLMTEARCELLHGWMDLLSSQ
ncbi:MAG: hypothetical protein SF069_15695 [Phycisphaerae bacterium]|nr:hypothetical protein [Phycisphaerae bacterium]